MFCSWTSYAFLDHFLADFSTYCTGLTSRNKLFFSRYADLPLLWTVAPKITWFHYLIKMLPLLQLQYQ
jgi:hypothetical protein